MASVNRKHDGWHNHKPLPVAINIRKGPSQPTSQDEPSFLTSLPPELRNEVYKWLFERHLPIVYDGHRSAHTRTPCFTDYCPSTCEELSHDELASLQGPPHDIGPSMAMLRACRQIYFEAVGVVYGANTFLISVNLQQHNRTLRQFNLTARFLQLLGSQVNQLTKPCGGHQPALSRKLLGPHGRLAR